MTSHRGRQTRCRPWLAKSGLARSGLVASLGALACAESYRIGEHVLVEYEGSECPAYLVDKRGETRFRVHFDFEGYDWQEEVARDRVLGRVEAPVAECPLPQRVRATLGLLATAKTEARSSPYKVGDRVRVRWRNSIYPATITRVAAADSVVVHYHGHEDVWDETISVDRIETEHR